jgi:hypothetical protein
MKKLGMDTLIIGAAVVPDGSFYPSNQYPSFTTHFPDPIGTLMTLAGQQGIKVFLGLYDYSSQWQKNGTYPDMVRRYQQVSNELANRYTKRYNFAGWYLTHECANWIDPSSQEATALKQISDHCHRLTPGKPVLIAPYFTKEMLDETQCEQKWRKMLPALGVDIVALQDGVGCDRGLTADNVVSAYRAVSKVCREQKVQFWSDLEVFQIRDWSPAPIHRVNAQIKSESPYVQKIVIWEFNHYMSLHRSDRTRQLYNDYHKSRTQLKSPSH